MLLLMMCLFPRIKNTPREVCETSCALLLPTSKILSSKVLTQLGLSKLEFRLHKVSANLINNDGFFFIINTSS